MFSDETTLELHPPQHQFIRRSYNETPTEIHFQQSFKHPVELMFWGCMSWQGMGRLQLVEGMMKKEQYLEVLQHRVLPQADDWFEGCDWVFQQDLAPCHTAGVVKDFFRDNDVTVLEWPGNSPDLNPIENLWAILKNRFGKRGIRTKPEAIRWMLDVAHHAEDITEICSNLVDSMPRRISACIKAKGGHINY